MNRQERQTPARWKTWHSRFEILFSRLPEQFFLRVCEYWRLQFRVHNEVFEAECDGHFRTNEPLLSFTFEGHWGFDYDESEGPKEAWDFRCILSKPFTCDVELATMGPNSLNWEHRYDCVWGWRRMRLDEVWQDEVDEIWDRSAQLLSQMPYLAVRSLSSPLSFCYADVVSHKVDHLYDDELASKFNCPTFHAQWELVGTDVKDAVVVRITSFALIGVNQGNDPLLVQRSVELTCTRGEHGKTHIVSRT